MNIQDDLDRLKKLASESNETISFHLPFPPSVNQYWMQARNGSYKYLSKEAKEFRNKVIEYVRENHLDDNWEENIACIVYYHPKDLRIRDIDNYAKGLFDALKHAGVYGDDCQIKVNLSFMSDIIKEGCVQLTLYKLIGGRL